MGADDEEEKASLRGADEEGSSSHIGDVDARSSAGEEGGGHGAGSATKLTHRHKLLALLGVLFLIAIILAIALATSNAEERIASDSAVVGINDGQASEPPVTEETAEIGGDLQSLEVSWSAVPSQIPSMRPSYFVETSGSPTSSAGGETPQGSSSPPATSPPSKEPSSPDDDMFGMGEFFDDGGCFDGFSEMTCCFLGFFC